MASSKGSKTKEKIIATAIKLFYKKGFNIVSFQMLAEPLDMAQASFYRYFSDKEDLLASCALYCAEHGRNYIDNKINADEPSHLQLKSYIFGNLNWAFEFPEKIHCLLTAYNCGHYRPSLKDVHKKINDVGIERIRRHIVRGNLEKTWQFHNADIGANLIHSLLYGEMTKMANWKKDAQKATEEIYSTVYSILLNGRDM